MFIETPLYAYLALLWMLSATVNKDGGAYAVVLERRVVAQCSAHVCGDAGVSKPVQCSTVHDTNHDTDLFMYLL